MSVVRMLGFDSEVGVKEIVKGPSSAGDSGWLIRFFDSAFFCEWIAISYLYKYEHQGVRDYLCNRMYALPHTGIESYLAQLCYMVVHRSSPALDRFLIDICAKSLRIALKVHWFLLAEQEESGNSASLNKLREKCQTSALMGDWPPLIRPKKIDSNPSPTHMFKHLLSSRRLLNLSSSSSPLPSPSPSPSPLPISPKPTSPTSLVIAAASFTDQEPPKNVATDEPDSSLTVFQKLMPGTKARSTLFKKFSMKEDGDAEHTKENETEAESFFGRFLKDKDKDKDKDDNDTNKVVACGEELTTSDSFFWRFFRDKADTPDDKSLSKSSDEDSFFRRLLSRDKAEDKEKVDDKERNQEDEKQNASLEGEEVSDFFFFRRIFRVHPDGEERPTSASAPEVPAPNSENTPVSESFIKKLFRERSFEDNKSANLRKEDSFSASSFLMKFKLFKDKPDEAVDSVSDSVVEADKSMNNDGATKDQCSEPRDVPLPIVANGFHEAVALHTEDCNGKPDQTLTECRRTEDNSSRMDISTKNAYQGNGVADQAFSKSVDSGSSPLPETSANTPTNFPIKYSGSQKQRTEKIVSKPPLPKCSSSQLRKDAYQATLDFMQSLCEISTGLADVFPMEDRRKSLQESLVELNSFLKAAQNDGGVCFPMGAGLYQIFHIPEDEAILLNSRERAPYSICLEVVKCDEKSPVREPKEASSHKLPRGGIPLANGDVQLQRPPPWAYPVWNQSHVQGSSTNNMLREASKAIDQAMNNTWEVKCKFVHVSLSVTQRCIGDAQDQTNERVPQFPDDHAIEVEDDPMQTDSEGYERDPTSLDSRDSASSSCTDTFQFGIGGSSRLTQNFRERDTQSSKSSALLRVNNNENGSHLPCDEWVSVILTAIPGLNMEDIGNEEAAKKKDHRRVPSTVAMAQVKAAAAKGESPLGLPVKKAGTETTHIQSEDISGNDGEATDTLAGELWENKKDRIRKLSKNGNLPGWDLHCVIVKSGDDCRQEHMAVQLISHFYDIFQEAGLPLWLHPYEILVTSSSTALIEMIPDTASIHSIKSRNPNISSLRDFFCQKYEDNSPSFKLAQRNFVESMAAYSILCYILQVKDRHNGNLLLDEEGHIIHIDFGFMLSNSPGGVNFESAPFKLTRELLEVMDSDAEGTASEFFDYFKVLCIQGFLICRKHAERIILLIEMMQDSGYPCFKAGPKTIQNLWKRFHLTLTEEQCVSLVLSLISSSLDAWRTRQYDYYQRVLNGIL